jgi:hypothetical protein
MRKLALLIAAALVVSAPLAATMSTTTYAAAKKATKKAGPAPRAGEGVDPGEANGRFARALGDLAMALGTYIYVPPGADGGSRGAKKAAKKKA